MINGFTQKIAANKRFIYDIVITVSSASVTLYCAAVYYKVLFLLTPYLILRFAYRINAHLVNQQEPIADTGGFDIPAYSIIICSYNEKKENLQLLFDSIANSTVQPQEIIIVDDCSNEHVVADERLRDKTRVIRNERNLRLRGSQIVGITHLNPVQHVLLLDSDVYFGQTAIERSLRFIQQHGDGKIFGVRITIKDFRKDHLNTFINTSYHSNYYKRLFESSLGVTLTCNGAFLLCEYQFLKNSVPAFASETFGGEPILTGNDKSLTNLALQQGKSYTIPNVAVTHDNFDFSSYIKKIQRAFKTSLIYQVRTIFLKNVSAWVRTFSTLDVISFFIAVPLQFVLIAALLQIKLFYVIIAGYFIVLAIRNNKSILKIVSYTFFRFGFTALLYALRLLTLFRLRRTSWGNR